MHETILEVTLAVLAVRIANAIAPRVRLAAPILLVVFGIMTPMGAWIGEHVLLDPDMLRNTLALVIGSLLHIATTILFETEQGHYHRVGLWKLIAILTGIALSLVSL